MSAELLAELQRRAKQRNADREASCQETSASGADRTARSTERASAAEQPAAITASVGEGE